MSRGIKNGLKRGSALVAIAALMVGCGPQGGNQSADDYPNKNIEMVVGFAAGGQNDTAARKFAAALEKELGSKVLVVNRTGGGGVIAATEASRASADGYSVLFAPTGAFTSGMLRQEVSYEIDDFRSIQPVSANAFMIAVPADSPVQSLADLEKLDGRLTYAHLGQGHSTHVIGEYFVQEKMKEATGEGVAFEGSPEATQALINNDVDFAVLDVSTALAPLRNGDVRALAISKDESMEQLEGVPTFKEEGLETIAFVGSQALVVPKDVPADIVEKLEQASAEAVQEEGFEEFLDEFAGWVPGETGAGWFEDFMPQERERFVELYEKLGI
ncbi:tripartite tricarboxylate transporter substrate binding protein [Micrococcoides hystricis]|uniref:Tripartite tricarboxylate transporter substrate binding protein n=1 Tax=Micrococcoides hystricis TaxID=1572761 RepID=A0ABV6PAP2_9MICC